MKAQAEISRQRLSAFVGKKMTVMLDEVLEPAPENQLRGYAHSRWQEIEVDGAVAVVEESSQAFDAKPGDLLEVEAVDSLDYDLVARPR